MRKKSVKRKARKPRSVTSRKKSFLFWQRGDITLYLLIGVIIIGAFFLAGGFSKFTMSPASKEQVGEVIPLTPGDSRNDLQLQTLNFQACGATTAVDFLIDTSGSMSHNNKLQNIKNALTTFASKLTDKSVVGIRRFSSIEDSTGSNCPPHTATSRLVPIDFYASNKTAFSQAVNSLCATGATNTKAAFSEELTELTAAVQNPAYKDTPLNLVFISDGIPESGDLLGRTLAVGATCQSFQDSRYPICAPFPEGGGCRCYDSNQDPTASPHIAKLIQDLKNINGKNVHVFSILVYDQANDAPFLDKLEGMMKAIASSPSDYYPTADSAAITGIYNQIASKICASNATDTTATPAQ